MKLSLQEFVPPPIPDEENIAAIPVFQRLASASEPKPPAPFKFPPGPPKFPSQREPAIDFEAWRRYCVEQHWIEQNDAEAPAAALLRGLDAQFGEAWEQLRAAVERPRGQFRFDWSKGVFSSSPFLITFFNVAKLANLRAAAELAVNNPAAAYREVHVLLRLNTVPEEDPMMVAFLVRTSAMATALDALQPGFNSHAWTGRELDVMATDLSLANPLRDYRFAVETERAAMTDLFARMRTWNSPDLQSLFAFTQPSVPLELLGLFPKGWLYDNQLRANQYLDGLLRRIDFEAARFQAERSWLEIEAKPHNSLEALHYIFFFVGTPLYSDIETKALRLHRRCSSSASRWSWNDSGSRRNIIPLISRT